MTLRSLGYALAVVAFIAGSAAAQEITGDIRGVVKDPSGAVVSGATVKVNNADRGATIRTLTTGADGSYVAPYLPVGHYQVLVEAPGFKRFVTTDIVLNVNDHRIVDVALQLGSASETVTVQESPVAVDLETSQAAGLVNGTQIREQALATRNFTQLLILQPGVTSALASDQLFVGVTNPTGTSNQINFSVNGTRPTQQNWTIDGADNFDRGANLTLLNFPSIDSIAEFKLLRSNYLPENGRSSGGQVNLVTRSGTNAFHGSAYEFFRNDVLEANNYFNNLNNLPRPPLRWNDFGFTLGGPIRKDKTFFFYSMEWRRIITYNSFTSNQLPSSAELGGTFPIPVCVAYNPNGSCVTGTQVTAVNPVAAAYVKDIYSKIPAANTDPCAPASSCPSLAWTGRNIFDYREENVRIDHTFNSKLSIFGRYLDDAIPTQEPGGLFTGLGLPGVATTSTNAPGRNFAFHATYIFSPNLVNDAGYAFSYGAVLSNPTGLIGKNNSPDISPTLPFNTGVQRVPDLDFSSFTFGPNSGDYPFVTGFGPYRDYNRNHNLFDNLTWVHGRHALKFGVSYNYYTKDENVNGGGGGANGTFQFSDGSILGDGPPAAVKGSFEQLWANFLTGTIVDFNQTNVDFRALVHQHEIEFYGQDEFRIRHNFTLNYGLRYSFFLAPTYGNGFLSTFDPRRFNSAQAPALNPDGTFPDGTDSGTYTNGIIIGGKNSPFGQAVQRTPHNGWGPRLGFAWDPFSTGKTSVRGGYGIFVDSPAVGSVENFVPSNPPLVQTITIDSPSFGTPGSGTAAVNHFPRTLGGPSPNNWDLPSTQMYSLDVQHQITPKSMLDVGYYGSQGRHLLGVLDINMPHVADFLKAGISPPFEGSFSNLEMLNLVRPYKGYDAINTFETIYTSNYNSLQVQFQKQFTDNSLITANYTYSKNLTNASNDFRAPQYTYDIAADYGPADFDRRHVFTGSYVYYLPFYKKQQGLIGHVLGGWELSGIGYLYTGLHYTATASSSSQDLGGLGLAGNTFSGARPDLVSNPQQGAPNTIDEWFNTSAFQLLCTDASCPASLIRPGNEKRGTIEGPPMVRWDANLYKNTKLTERTTLQFRAEAFNVLNHTNFNTFRSLRDGSSLFGQIGSARDARVMQLALKLLF
jgi:Carboxypeptidase regulatory-like domain